jgi:Lar family restriction alleviation protein
MSMHIENCPFCGSANVKPYEHINEPTDSYCQCADCGTIGPSGKESSKDSAIVAWNLRAALQAQQGEAKDAPTPATLSKSQIDAIVYQCRQSGSDTTYDIVAACLAAAGSSQGQDGKDAERYRFRKSFLQTGGCVMWTASACQYRKSGELVSMGKSEEDAIDAAIAALAAKEAKNG